MNNRKLLEEIIVRLDRIESKLSGGGNDEDLEKEFKKVIFDKGSIGCKEAENLFVGKYSKNAYKRVVSKLKGEDFMRMVKIDNVWSFEDTEI